MYIDIDAGIIGDEPIIGTFKETGPGTAISQVRLEFDGLWQWCEVIGWSDAGPQVAWLTPIEESGDGPALLLHGGNQGLRLRLRDGGRPAASALQEAADAQGWWPEGFLILRPEIQRA